MPATLLERIDAVAEEHGYTGRSEVLRDASRTLLADLGAEGGQFESVVATVTVLFRPEEASDGERLELDQDSEDVITDTLQTRVGNGYELLVFVLDGDFEQITGLVEHVRADRDMLLVDHEMIPLDPLVATR